MLLYQIVIAYNEGEPAYFSKRGYSSCEALSARIFIGGHRWSRVCPVFVAIQYEVKL